MFCISRVSMSVRVWCRYSYHLFLQIKAVNPIIVIVIIIYAHQVATCCFLKLIFRSFLAWKKGLNCSRLLLLNFRHITTTLKVESRLKVRCSPGSLAVSICIIWMIASLSWCRRHFCAINFLSASKYCSSSLSLTLNKAQVDWIRCSISELLKTG